MEDAERHSRLEWDPSIDIVWKITERNERKGGRPRKSHVKIEALQEEKPPIDRISY